MFSLQEECKEYIWNAKLKKIYLILYRKYGSSSVNTNLGRSLNKTASYSQHVHVLRQLKQISLQLLFIFCDFTQLHL